MAGLQQLSTLTEAEDGVSIAISTMLMCAMTFFMGLFYLVNHSKELVRMRAWQAISSTISVFGSILIFRSCKTALEMAMAPFDIHSPWTIMGLAFTQTCIWYYLMMYVLGYAVKQAVILDGTAVEKHLLCVQLCTTFGTLFAHVTGFAALNMWARLQQMYPFNLSPLMTWCAVGVTATVTFVYVYVADVLYRVLSERVRKVCPVGVFTWQEYFYDATYDICGVCWGFSIVQALRYSITGTLPDLEGNDFLKHTPGEAWALLLIGIVAIVLKVVIFLSKPPPSETSREILSGNGFKKWFYVYDNIFSSALIMTSAWMLMWAVATWLEIFFGFGSNMLGVVVRSMVCSTWGFFLIMVLAYGQDAVSDEKQKCFCDLVEQITPSIGILIGFSWESCFDEAVEVASRALLLPLGEQYTSFGKLTLSILVAMVVMPAWSWYIVPSVVVIEEEEKEEWQKDVLAHHDMLFGSGQVGFKSLEDEKTFMEDRVRQVEEQLWKNKKASPQEKFAMLRKLIMS
mmetsp:Transcript_51101/g.121409  ORF Transcript_51101/g.121409 Transcript_51101/m.121409 type:complete len:513 (+) Transcript_51101:60-1598(+)